MNKLVLLLIVMAGIAVAAAVMLRQDVQRERARADALAQRVAVLEPVEEPANSPGSTSHTPPALLAVEREVELNPKRELAQPELQDAPVPAAKPKSAFRGSTRARRQVERLQAALVRGTPLQDYQIQALMTAIDEVSEGIAKERKASEARAATSNVEWQSRSREQLLQAAADILFESQLEVFIALVDTEPDAPALDRSQRDPGI